MLGNDVDDDNGNCFRVLDPCRLGEQVFGEHIHGFLFIFIAIGQNHFQNQFNLQGIWWSCDVFARFLQGWAVVSSVIF